MFVEEGFRIRFANGEVIDFYADSAAEKDGWMKVLVEAVGQDSPSSARAWTSIVLEKERKEEAARFAMEAPIAPNGPAAQLQKAQAIREANAMNEQRRPSSAGKAANNPKSAPTSPQKRYTAPQSDRQHQERPNVPEKDELLDAEKRQKLRERRAQVKSMIF